MPPTHKAPLAKPRTGRYLSVSERENIAMELAKGVGIRAIACKLGAHQAQSHGKSAVMLLPEVVGWTTDQARRNGMLTALPVDRAHANWRVIRSSADMSRSVWLVKSPMEGARFRRPGSDVVEAASGSPSEPQVVDGVEPRANRAPP
jgi:hypothetical protein